MEFNFALCVLSKFLIFMASKLLGAKTKKSRFNEILNFIFIYIIVVIFKCARVYVRDYTLIFLIIDCGWLGGEKGI